MRTSLFPQSKGNECDSKANDKLVLANTREDCALQALAYWGVERVWCFETSDRSDLKISDLGDVIEPLSP